MNRLQLIKKSMLAYVNSMKYIWSSIAYPLSIVGKKFTNLADYHIFGNSEQNGTPTPDNPIEVESVGDLVADETSEYYGKYKIPIIVRGKNLWDRGSYILSNNSSPGSIFRRYMTSDCPWIQGGNKVALSGKVFISESDTRLNPRVSLNVIYKDNTNKYILWKDIKKGVETDISLSVTLPSSKAIKQLDLRLLDHGGNSEGIWDGYAKNIQFELGDSVTEYEPYINPITTNIYLNEPLRKLGNYADYVDFKNKKIVRQIVKKTYNGAENWGKNGDAVTEGYRTFTLIDNTILPKGSSNVYPPIKCNKFKTYSGMSYIRNDNCWNVTKSAYNIRTTVSVDRLTEATKEGWKTFLADNPVTVYYVRATELEEIVNPPALPQFKGTTIYEVGTSMEPSGIEVKYC